MLRPRAAKILLNNWLKGQEWFHPFYKHIRHRRFSQGGHINWKPLLKKLPPTEVGRGNTRILIATSTGAQLAASYLEQTLGVALQLRGQHVSFLLCDGVLPACMLCEYSLMRDADNFVAFGPSLLLCDTCFTPAARALEPLGIPLHRYSEYLHDSCMQTISEKVAQISLKSIKDLVVDSIPVGEHAYAGACRFFGVANPFGMPGGEQVVRQFLRSALITKHIAEALIQKEKPDVVLMHHGIYVPQGIIAAVAKKHGARLVTWHPAYRKNTFIFSHDDTYHRTMIDEPTESWENMPWDESKRLQLHDYLQSRKTGKGDWIWFHEKPEMGMEVIQKTLRLDPTQPTIGLLTNVAWDAQLHYPNNAYSDMFAWLYDTVDFFIKRPDMQLIIRIHPAEIYGNVLSRQTTEEALKTRYGKLPAHIKIVPPLSDLSTYALMDLCSTVLIYSTKTGIELAAGGKHVVVCGDSWLRGKALADDISNPQEYLALLERLPIHKTMDAPTRERAERYAYHFFFRRMIELSIFKHQPGWPPFALNIESMDELKEGKCSGLDNICRGLLQATEFAID